MKKIISAMAPVCTAFLAFAWSQEPQVEDQQKVETKVEQWQIEFGNLPESERIAFAEGFDAAARMFRQKRVFESLRRLEEIEDIFAKFPELANLKGACFVEFRDFESAQEHFNRAVELAPNSLSVRFNIAEVDFVRGRWNDAYDKLAAIVEKIGERDRDVVQLSRFKMFISATKAGKKEEAEMLAKEYDELLDDTPYFYCVKFIQSMEDGEKQAAANWLKAAEKVYSKHSKKSQELTAFKDALIESGYLESFYGNQHDELVAP